MPLTTVLKDLPDARADEDELPNDGLTSAKTNQQHLYYNFQSH